MASFLAPLVATVRRTVRQLASRPLYLCAIIVVPVGFALYFNTLMTAGLPVPVPAAVVDCDGSPLSRQVVRTLQATQSIDLATTPVTYSEALADVRTGRIYGFFYIPVDFQRRAFAGDKPSLVFYSNMSIFVPGTFAFKGFKTTAVTTRGGLVATTLTSLGMPPGQVTDMVQPLVVQDHPLNNPWMNYSYYLNPGFIISVLVLMIMLVTTYTLGEEIKRGTSGEWLATAGESVTVAVGGKLLPQTVLFVIVGWAVQALCYGFFANPLNCPLWRMLLAMALLVTASQAFALMVFELMPNLRIALSVCSLLGILTFSIDGFSFPVPQMYGAIGIFSYITPMRYYFLIHADQALNGIPLYWSRWYYIVLALFPVLSLPGLAALKRRLQRPVYCP